MGEDAQTSPHSSVCNHLNYTVSFSLASVAESQSGGEKEVWGGKKEERKRRLQIELERSVQQRSRRRWNAARRMRRLPVHASQPHVRLRVSACAPTGPCAHTAQPTAPSPSCRVRSLCSEEWLVCLRQCVCVCACVQSAAMDD